jgi:hypothetical protein
VTQSRIAARFAKDTVRKLLMICINMHEKMIVSINGMRLAIDQTGIRA